MFASKVRAFTVHLLLSLLLLCGLFMIAYFIWFPNGLIHLGATAGFKIIVLVDIILGPLLTFIVFDKRKKSLGFDLTVIAIIQLAGLVYGMSIVYKERPVLAVLGTDAMHVFLNEDFENWGLANNLEPYAKPKVHYLDFVNDIDESIKSEIEHELTLGRPLASKAELHKNISEVSTQTFKARVKLLQDKFSKERSEATQYLTKYNEANCVWLPIMSKHADFAWGCLSQDQGLIEVRLLDHTNGITEL